MVGGQISNTLDFAFIPRIFSVSPISAPTIGNVPVSIRGSSFGLTPGTVVIGVSCPIVSWNDVAIVCTLPPGTGQAVPIIITTDAGRTPISPMRFTYDPPVINSITPGGGAAGGGYPLTIAGRNFFTSGVGVTVGAASCPVIDDVDNPTYDRIICTLPPGAPGAASDVIVSVAEWRSNRLQYYYDPFMLTDTTVEPDGLVKITGTSFGVDIGTATVNGLPCVIASWSDSLVTCTLQDIPASVTSVDLNASNGVGAVWVGRRALSEAGLGAEEVSGLQNPVLSC
jgi:hypothetical protein